VLEKVTEFNRFRGCPSSKKSQGKICTVRRGLEHEHLGDVLSTDFTAKHFHYDENLIRMPLGCPENSATRCRRIDLVPLKRQWWSILWYRFELFSRIDWLEWINSLMIDRWILKDSNTEIRSRVWTNLDLSHPREHQAAWWIQCNSSSSLRSHRKRKLNVRELRIAVLRDGIIIVHCPRGLPNAAVSRDMKYRNAASSGVLRQCVAAGKEG